METLVALLPAALGAGVVAVAVTVAIERWGGRVGGLLGTMPSTIVPAALGIFAQAEETEHFRQAMDLTPWGMLLNASFLWLWRVLPPRLPPWGLRARLAAMTALSLGAWLCGAVLLVTASRVARDAGVPTLAIGIAGFVALVTAGVLATVRARPAPRGSRSVSPVALAMRGLLAAGAIATAVWLASTGGSFAAGVVSVFPAIFLTTMFALWLAQGEAVPSGAVGPMMLGSSSVAAYALLARWALPEWGPWGGAIAAWVVAVLATTAPAFFWVRWRKATGPAVGRGGR